MAAPGLPRHRLIGRATIVVRRAPPSGEAMVLQSVVSLFFLSFLSLALPGMALGGEGKRRTFFNIRIRRRKQ